MPPGPYAGPQHRHSRRVLPRPVLIGLWVASLGAVLTYSHWSCSSLSSSLSAAPTAATPAFLAPPTDASLGGGPLTPDGAVAAAAFTPSHTAHGNTEHHQHQQQQLSTPATRQNQQECPPRPGPATSTASQQQPSRSSSSSSLVPTAEEVLATFEGQWGPQSCVVLRNACMDEGVFVTFGDNPYPPLRPSSSSSSSSSSIRGLGVPWHTFKLGVNNHLDFRGFGDVAGITQYPTPIIRPGGPDEEAPDLRTHYPQPHPHPTSTSKDHSHPQPQLPHHQHPTKDPLDPQRPYLDPQAQPAFSACSRPVVLYLNFLYAFGDWWLRAMPTFLHALAAGAWDDRYDVIIATGGQRLEAWQKLVLAPLTQHPVVTLSAASSRALAAVDAAAVSAYGRCFELLTLCSVPEARVFPLRPNSSSSSSSDGSGGDATPDSSSSSSSDSSSSSSTSEVPREAWAGAQYVKQYYMQRYGQQYHQLPQQYKRLQEPGAFRVVFAVRGSTAAAAAGMSPGAAGSSSSSSGVQGNLSPEQLAGSTRQLLNVGELLQWCNSWKPVPAGAGDLEGVDTTAAAAAAGGGGGKATQRYSHTVCIAHQFGQHGKVHTLPRPGSSSGGGSSSGSWWGRLRRRLAGAAAAAGTTQQQQQQQQQQQVLLPWGDPELDPRALMVDFAVLDNADVLIGLHGAQLYNALFMAPHKALVEVRPYGFWGGWPQTYFHDPLVKVDRDQSILWFGLDTVNASNSRPGRWEAQGVGVQGTYARDRHTRVEPAALEVLLGRILWAAEDPAAYKELKYAGLKHITDTLQPAQQYHAALQKAQAAAMLQHRQRPEVAAAVLAAKGAG